MKNKILSGGIFKEGVRQLRAVGIAFSCICALVMMFHSISAIDQAICVPYKTTFYYNDISMRFAMVIGIYIVLPVMSLMIFNFLNSRSACDFYHSMPKTRVQLALSFGLSVAFWFFVPILSVTATETLMGLIFWDSVDFASIGMFLLNTVSMFIHIYGILLLAVSLATGILNQIAAAGIIAFLPRVMLLIMGAISENAAPVLIGMNDSLGAFGDIYFNLLFENGVLTGYYIFENTVIAKNIYSIALGLSYGTLGMVCFCRRKSEAATVSGANKYVQCAIRVLVAFVICLVPCYVVGSSIIRSESKREILVNVLEDLPTLLLCYGFALVAYFLYEAITAKKIRGVITFKGTMGIGLLALAALNVLFIAVPVVSANMALKADVNTDNVESVSLYSRYNEETYGIEYHEIGLSEVKFEDTNIVSSLCKALKKDIDEIEAGRFYDYINRSGMTSVNISFNMEDGRTFNRRVYLPSAEFDKIYEAMCDDEDYVAMQRRMPTVEECEGCYTDVGFSDAQTIKLYETLRNELSNMSDEDYFSCISPYSNVNNDKEYGSTLIGGIYLEGKKGKTRWASSYQISKLVPETFQMYMDMCNEYNDFDEVSFAEYFKNSEETHITVTLINYLDENGELLETESWSVDFTEEAPNEDDIEIIEFIDKYWNEPVDANKPIYIIDYFIDDYDLETDSEYTWVNGVHFVPAEELIEEMGFFIGK